MRRARSCGSKPDSAGAGRAKRPAKTPATALLPDEPDILFQSAGPFRARAIVWQIEPVSQFSPGGAVGVFFQMVLDGCFELEVGHGGGRRQRRDDVEALSCRH